MPTQNQPNPNPNTISHSSDLKSATDPEFEIRDFYSKFSDAINAGDLERILSFYAPDVVAFDMMPPLKMSSLSEYKKAWDMYVQNSAFPMNGAIHNLQITVSGELCATNMLVHMLGETKDGKSLDMWFRNSGVLKKINGAWKLIHEHNSVPIDMQTEKAMWNLKPEHLSH